MRATAAPDPTLGINIGDVLHADSQSPVTVRPATWQSDRYKAVTCDLDLPTSISRDALVTAAATTAWSSDREVRSLFVTTMMWGSGTSNGRGPRNTASVLSLPGVCDLLRSVRADLAANEVVRAYDTHRQLHGLGPAFHTKWMWLLGRITHATPQPLILDSRVWASLANLGWNSVQAAGSRNRGQRYIAYLRACESWAESTSVTPEDVEYTLFHRAR